MAEGHAPDVAAAGDADRADHLLHVGRRVDVRVGEGEPRAPVAERDAVDSADEPEGIALPGDEPADPEGVVPAERVVEVQADPEALVARLLRAVVVGLDLSGDQPLLLHVEDHVGGAGNGPRRERALDLEPRKVVEHQQAALEVLHQEARPISIEQHVGAQEGGIVPARAPDLDLADPALGHRDLDHAVHDVLGGHVRARQDVAALPVPGGDARGERLDLGERQVAIHAVGDQGLGLRRAQDRVAGDVERRDPHRLGLWSRGGRRRLGGREAAQ